MTRVPYLIASVIVAVKIAESDCWILRPCSSCGCCHRQWLFCFLPLVHNTICVQLAKRQQTSRNILVLVKVDVSCIKQRTANRHLRAAI